MKKQIIIALTLLVGTLAFAQKDEMKAAERAIKKGDYADAKSSVKAAEGFIGSMDDKTKAKFYFLKGQAFYANGTGSNDDMNTAIESLNMVETVEGSTGKYSNDVAELKNAMVNKVLPMANDLYKSKKFIESAHKFEVLYKVVPQDTTYLYYAAISKLQGQDYDSALTDFEKLKNMGYNGIETTYTAVNKETNEVENFGNKNMRDISVKAGTHIKPEDNVSGSKRPDIVKYIAQIYSIKGESEKGIEAYNEALKENPDDMDLVLGRAGLYFKLGDKEKFKASMEDAIKKQPDNPSLHYNIGVISLQNKNFDEAKKAFEKCLELKPDYFDAALNLSTTYIDEGNGLITQMNALGNSDADNKKYDELRDKKDSLFMEGAKVLESYINNNANPEIDIYEQLVNIYNALGDVEKSKATKAKIEELKK